MGQINNKHTKPFGNGFQPETPRPPVEIIGGVLDIEAGAGSKNAGQTNRDAAAETYDLEGGMTLNVFFSEDNGSTYHKVSVAFVDADFVDPAAATADEVATVLNANETFARYFTASDASGTLRFNGNMPSTRFKFYFTGDAATALGGICASAVAAGSATNSGSTAGVAQEFQVQDQQGNGLGNFPVFVSAHVSSAGGAGATSAWYGLVSKGVIVDAAVGGKEDVAMVTDENGYVAFYVADQNAETLVTVVRPGHATAKLAQALQGAGDVVFS